MANFAIHNLATATKDIQRSYLFGVTIAGMDKYIGTDELFIRARTAAMPQRGNSIIESIFMGMKMYFPGKPTMANTLKIEFEEYEDRKVSTALYAWQQDIFDVQTAGASLLGKKADMVKEITLDLYGYDGNPINGGGKGSKIFFHKAWVSDVPEVALAYSADTGIMYAPTFIFDRWEMN